jgi:Uma2 family endonuclease
MATVTTPSTPSNRLYPASDGRPMTETDYHRQDMTDLIETLQVRYAGDPQVYVSGNLLIFYVPGNKRKHLAPDVFVVQGVSKHPRLNYLIWEEGKGPDAVIELTSSSTRAEDTKKKFALYQDMLKVQEYFLFDPRADYLDPPLQGFRRERGKFKPIQRVRDRLPSKVLGLHLERSGWQLRLYDPETEEWLKTPAERAERALADFGREALARQQAETAAAQANEARSRAEAELERLRQELDSLRGSR